MSTLSVSKFYMNVLNTTNIHNKHYLERALFHRPPGQPLLSFSNHTSTVDDPLVLAAMTPLSGHPMRHILGAEEVVMGGTFAHQWFFTKAGRVLPVRRGAGPFQPGLDAAIHLMSTRAIWLHIFVEGKVHPHSQHLLTPIKHGIARVVLECKPRPLLLPFVHTGMEHVKPYGSMLPRINKNVDVYVGEPIDSGRLVNTLPPVSEPALYFGLTRHLQEILSSLYPPPINPT